MGYASFLLMLIFAALLIPFSASASNAAADAMRTAAETVIPSLFPFIVCANYLLNSGIFERVRRIKGYFGFPLFFLFTALCGTPSAAFLCCEFSDLAVLDKKRASVLCAVLNLPGPVFILTVTEGFYGARQYALMLAASVYAPALIASIILGFISPYCADNQTVSHRHFGALELLSVSVSEAVFTVLRVSGTIVFFRVVYSLAESLGITLVLPLETRGLTLGMIEMTNGLIALSKAPNQLGMTLSAFLLTFGGLCIFTQTKMIFAGLQIKAYFVTKLGMAFVSAVMNWVLYPALSITAPTFFELSNMAAMNSENTAARLICLLSGGFICVFTLAVSMLYSKLAAKR